MRTVVVWLVLVALVSGCSVFGGDEGDTTAQADVATVAPPTLPATEEDPSPRPTPSSEPTATTTPSDGEDDRYPDDADLAAMPFEEACTFAGEEFCEDANGNVWPDVLEVAVGSDPTTDECAEQGCIGTSLEEFLLSLQDNTLFILDASGSMAGDAGGGQTKMDAAKEALVGYVQSTPDFADLGLMVYGHRGDNSDAGQAESCAGIETLAPVGDLDRDSAAGVIGQFQATGWTPIAASLDAAGPVLQAAVEADRAEDIEGATNRIILVSDGIETCGGDPVASAQALVDLGIEVVVDVIGFDLAEGDRAALQQVADVTGGVYRDAADGRALRDVLAEYNRQWREAVEPIRCQRFAIRDLTLCTRLLSRSIQQEMQARAREARDDGDTEWASFLTRWLSVLRGEVEGRLGSDQDTLQAQLETFEAQLDQALAAADDARARGASNQKVSVTPACDATLTALLAAPPDRAAAWPERA